MPLGLMHAINVRMDITLPQQHNPLFNALKLSLFQIAKC